MALGLFCYGLPRYLYKILTPRCGYTKQGSVRWGGFKDGTCQPQGPGSLAKIPVAHQKLLCKYLSYAYFGIWVACMLFVGIFTPGNWVPV